MDEVALFSHDSTIENRLLMGTIRCPSEVSRVSEQAVTFADRHGTVNP